VFMIGLVASEDLESAKPARGAAVVLQPRAQDSGQLLDPGGGDRRVLFRPARDQLFGPLPVSGGARGVPLAAVSGGRARRLEALFVDSLQRAPKGRVAGILRADRVQLEPGILLRELVDFLPT